MKTSANVALVFAASLAAPVAAAAQTAVPHHAYHVRHFEGPHHYVQHRYVAHTPRPVATPVAATTAPAPAAAPFGLSWPHIAPYPDGKGDEDGLSEDPNDCNKGCIDGNTPD